MKWITTLYVALLIFIPAFFGSVYGLGVNSKDPSSGNSIGCAIASFLTSSILLYIFGGIIRALWINKIFLFANDTHDTVKYKLAFALLFIFFSTIILALVGYSYGANQDEKTRNQTEYTAGSVGSYLTAALTFIGLIYSFNIIRKPEVVFQLKGH